MDDVDIYLDSALKKDAKLCKFIQGTLENGPASDSDDEESEESLSFMPPKNSDSTAIGMGYESSSGERVPVEMDQSLSCDPFESSLFDLNVSDDNLPDLTLHFAEPNDFEKDCVSAHVRRLRRELREAAKRKTKRHEQPNQRQFTGKPMEVVNNIQRAMKPKPLRQRKKPFGLEEKSSNI